LEVLVEGLPGFLMIRQPVIATGFFLFREKWPDFLHLPAALSNRVAATLAAMKPPSQQRACSTQYAEMEEVTAFPEWGSHDG
jgi:hypothetical protein